MKLDGKIITASVALICATFLFLLLPSFWKLLGLIILIFAYGENSS